MERSYPPNHPCNGAVFVVVVKNNNRGSRHKCYREVTKIISFVVVILLRTEWIG